MTDRWRQIEPKVLVAVDGYRYGGKEIDRREEVAAIHAALPSLEHVITIGYLDPAAWRNFTAFMQASAILSPRVQAGSAFTDQLLP